MNRLSEKRARPNLINGKGNKIFAALLRASSQTGWHSRSYLLVHVSVFSTLMDFM